MASSDLNDRFGFGKSAQELEKLSKALSSSFNSSLGMLDLSKLKTELKDAGVSAKTLGEAFRNGGAQGQIAFNNLLGQIGKIDVGLKRSSSTVDKMFNTIANTVRWGVVSSGFSAMLNSLHESVNYVKELDDAMTQIMLVTDYSRQQMNDYAKSANEAAKALGNTTVGVMQGTQVFAQQGYNLQQSGQLAELSIKLANASEQDSATTSDQITALMNAYGLNKDMGALSSALDSWAKVANVSAADVEELAKASQKAASTAATVDVSLEQLNAQIATIESVTKEAPEQIGNGLKTLYARFSDLEMGETLEDGVTLGKVTSVLNDIGVEVLDAQGQMRGVGDMIEDMMEVWSDLNATQKASVAQTVAGKYQLGRFEALMNSPEMYDEYAKASMDAEGTLDQMNEEYVNSLKGKTARLQATLEGLFNSVFNPDNFYPAIDALTKFVDLIKNLIDSVGGGQTVLAGVIALFGKLFSNNMAQMISDYSANKRIEKIREENAKNVPAILDQLGYSDKGNLSADQNKIVDYVKYIQQNQGSMSEGQAKVANETLEDSINSLNRYEEVSERVKKSAEELNIILGTTGEFGGRSSKNANGKWEILEALEELQNFDDSSFARLKKDIDDNIGKTIPRLKEYIEEIKRTGEAWSNAKTPEQAQEKYTELEQSIKRAKTALEEIRIAISPDAYQELCGAIDKAEQEYKELGTETVSADEKLKRSIQLLADLNAAKNQALDDLKNGGAQRVMNRALNTSTELTGAEASKDNALKMMQGVRDSTEEQKNIKNILDTVNAVNQLSFAWQSFQNLGSIWTNADLTTGEKFVQIISNLTMMIPALVNGLKDLKGSKIDIFSSLDKVNENKDIVKKLEGQRDEAAKVLSAQKMLEQATEGKIDIFQKRADAAERKYKGAVSAFQTNWAKQDPNASKAIRTKDMTVANSTKMNNAMEDYRKKTEDLEQAQKQLANTQETSKHVQDMYSAAQKEATTATESLKEAQRDLAIGIGGLVLTGAITAFSMYVDSVEKARQADKEFFEELRQDSETIGSEIDSFNSLYEKYKETGEGADELKESARQLVKDLGISGHEAEIAAGNFKALAAAVEEANNKNLDDLVDAAKKVRENSLGTGFWEAGAYGSALGTEAYKASTGVMRDSLGIDSTQNQDIKNIMSQTVIRDTKDDIGIINIMEERLRRFKELQEEHNDASLEEKRTQEWENTNREIERAIELTKNFLNLDRTREIKDAQEAEAESRAKNTDFQKQFEEKTNTQDILSTLAQDKDEVISKTFSDDRLSQLEKIEKALELIEDEGARAALSVSSVQESLANNNKNLNFSELLKGISLEDQEKIVGNLNLENTESKLKAQIKEVIRRLNEGEDLEVVIKTVLKEPEPEDFEKIGRYSQEKIEEILKAADLEGMSVPEAGNFLADSDFDDSIVGDIRAVREEYQALTKQCEEASDTFNKMDEDSPDYANARKNLQRLEKEVEDAEKVFEDTTVKFLETSNGMDELSEKWEDLNDAINNGTPLEQVQAYSELQNIIAQLLNVNPSAITQELMESEGALAALQDLANGDTDAIYRLREAFADPLHLKAYLDTTPLADEFPALQSLVEEAAAALPDLEVGAKLEDEEFLNALTEMCGSSSEAAAIIAEIFEGLGYDVDVDESDAMVFQGVTANFTSTGSFTPQAHPGLDVSAAMATPSGSTTVVDYNTTEGVSVKVPKFTFTKKGGNKGGHTFRSNTGGGGGGRGGGGGSCFIAGTKVSMQGYLKNIEKIQEGDIVLSYNEQTKRNEYSEVLQTMIHDTTENIYTLCIQNEKLRVTGIHKFFIIKENKTEWIAAKNLQIGDYVLYADGTKHQISKIKINLETQTVYNFKVSNNHNYYVGYNQILAHNKSSGKGKTPKTGGGGKGSQPKTKDPLKEKIDLYEKVNTKLDDVEEVLKKIQKETDRLIGTEGRANMNKQLSLLQREIDLQREKLRIQVKEREDLQKDLKKKYNVSFDSNGFIDNYSTVFKTLKSEYNKKVKEYNNASAEDQEKMEEGLEKAKKKFDDFKEDYQRYDQLQGKEIQETKNAIEELTDAMEDLRIKAYQSAMEAQEHLKELGDDMAHFNAVVSNNKLDSPLANLIENTEKLNNLFSNGKKPAIDYYNTLIAEQDKLLAKTKDKSQRRAIKMQKKFYQDQIKNIQNSDDLYAGGAIQAATDRVNRALEFLENPNSADNPFKGNTAALQEELENAREYLADLIEEAKKALEDQEKYVIERIQELEENQQYFIDQLQTVNDHMEKTMDIYNLAFGEENYEEMINVYTRMAETTQASFNQAKANYEYWKDIWDNMSEKERLEDVGKQVKKEVDEWKGQMLDSEKEIVEYWGEVFTATTQKALKDAAKTTFGRSNLDDIEANWQRDKNFSDRYYDNFQKQQRVEALRLKYMDLLDNAQNASLDTQRKIRDSMNEQVKYLEDQTYLSEYNVKYANAQLEILQKQIALEDARNNKNQMRLRRDSQGNYRYVYSANKDDTRQKEQDLLQSQMDVYDMSKQNKSDTIEAAFDLWRSTMEQLQALEERIRQGDEDAIRARDELLRDSKEAMKAYGLEYETSTDGMIKAVQWMAESGIESVQDVAAKALEALKSNNHEALQEMGIEGDAFLDNILENADTATSAINKAVQDMDEAITQYHNHLVATGGVFDNIQEGYSGISDAIGEASDATDKLVDATRTFKEIIRPEDGVLKNYIDQIETLRSNVTSLTNEKSAAVLAVRRAEEAEQKATTAATQYKLALDVKNGDRSIEKGGVFTLKAGTWVYYGRGGVQSDDKGHNGFKLPRDMQVKIKTTEQARDLKDPDVLAKYPIAFYATGKDLKEWGPILNDDDSEKGKTEKHKQHEGWHLDDTQFRAAIKMDTGGYTGEWVNGSDKNNGRFAMLHQKELVLNENDTANVLEAVQMVRTMTDALKLLGNMGAYKGTGFNKLGGDTIKQRVEITAEFPNVSNSNEIETALLSLADSAYQYSYRER